MSLLLCGCSSYREIERGYLVTALGFGQTNGKTTVTVEAMSSVGGDNASERVTLSAEGNGPAGAYNTLKLQLAKPLYFDHLGTVVVEDTLNPADVARALDFCNRLQAVSLGLYAVTTNDLQTLFNLQSPSGVLGYDIIGLIKNRNNQTGEENNFQLYNLQKLSDTAIKGCLPYVTVEQEQLKLTLQGVKK